MKGIYLGAFKAKHDNHDIVYQDINGLRDIGGDMLDVDLTSYDYVIATPPCNYYCRGNYRRDTSDYSQKTKHLLPEILKKLCRSDKLFIVENVQNEKLMSKLGLFDLPVFIYSIGRHTYWTNVFLDTQFLYQHFDNTQKLTKSKRQGGENVHIVVEMFLESIGA